MLINNGQIDNAVSLPVSINSFENIVSDIDFNIYPNPTNSTTTFSNLDSKRSFSFYYEYRRKNNTQEIMVQCMVHSLTFDVSNLSEEIYII